MNFISPKLRLRLLLLLLLGVIPALALIIYTNLELRRSVAVTVQQEMLRLVRLAANDQADTVKDTRQLLFALAPQPGIYNADPESCPDFLRRLSTQYPQYVQLGVIDPEGQVLCSSTPDGVQRVAEQEFFQQIRDSGRFTSGDYQLDPTGDNAVLPIGFPVVNEVGDLRAVVFATFDLSWLDQLIAEAELPAGATVTIFDPDGTILWRYPNPDEWVGQRMPDAPLVERILDRSGEGTAEAEGVDGLARLFAYTPLTDGESGVTITASVPTSVAFAEANRILRRNLIGLALVTALALAAVWFGSEFFILRWVRGLVEATQRLSAGEVGVRTNLPADQGELSHLARAFDEMAASLEDQLAERQQAETALRESQRTLTTLMSNLPGMAYRCRNNRNRTMEFVSEGCLALTGYQPADLIADQRVTYAQLIHPEDRRAVWLETQNALKEKRPFQIVYRLKTPARGIRWVWEQGQGVFANDDRVLALEGFISDTTERVDAYQILEQRVADRTRELAALYDVTAVASKSLELTTILEQSLDHVLAVMGSQAGTIHLFERHQDRLCLVTRRGAPPDIVDHAILAPGEGLVGRVFERGEPLVMPDLGVAKQPPQTAPVSQAQAYLGTPMRSRNRTLGVLSVVGKAGRQFKTEEVTLLASIADEVGVAVENAQLYAAERIRRRQADTLLHVASVVGSTLELDEVLSRILDQLRRVVEYDSASVQLLRDSALRIIAARGFADLEEVLETAFALDETPNTLVLGEGQPVNLADAPSRYPAFRRAPFAHIRSWLGVPLRVQDRIIGIIAVDRHRTGGYSEEEVRLTTAFADLAALALENARLYQQTEQLAVMEERSRLARELHDSVTQSLYSLTLFAEVGRRAVEAGTMEQVADYMVRLGQVAQQALKEMRLLVYELRTAALETEGLAGALQQRLDAVEKRAGVDGRLLVESMVELPAVVEEGLYRITQEALNNALKHAQAKQVVIRLRADEAQMTVEISDDGVAFAPDIAKESGGMGLTTMRERAERLGGTLTISSQPGQGTTVTATVPTHRSGTRSLPVEKAVGL